MRAFLFVFFFIPLTLNAQTYFLRYESYRDLGMIFPDFEDLVPETTTFDPHYDESGKIVHYTFGDKMRLNYAYNDRGEVEKKTLYIRFDADEIWNKFQETAYIYSGDKLMGKKVYEWDNYTQKHGISKPKLQEVWEYISDETRRTDTVKVSDSYYGKESKSFHIRYYSDKNRLDSLVTYGTSLEEIYSKSEFEYDKKGRCINEKVFVLSSHFPHSISSDLLQEDIEELRGLKHESMWAHGYTITVDYDKNGTTYSCLTPNGEMTYRLVLKNDNRGRLTEQIATHRGDILFKGEISYDNQGRTLVSKEVLDGSLSSIGRLSNFKYDLTYEEDDLQKVVYYNEKERQKKFQESFIKTNSSGLISFFQKNDYEDYGDEDSELFSQEKGHNEYDERGLLTQQIVYISIESGEGGFSWCERAKYIYEYDKVGTLISKTSYLKECREDNPQWKEY